MKVAIIDIDGSGYWFYEMITSGNPNWDGFGNTIEESIQCVLSRADCWLISHPDLGMMIHTEEPKLIDDLRFAGYTIVVASKYSGITGLKSDYKLIYNNGDIISARMQIRKLLENIRGKL